MNKIGVKRKKVIVIVGPTASGKSDFAVEMAHFINRQNRSGAEIVSADSRQVYKGMDIGTGKVTKKEMGQIPHHMLSISSPTSTFTVSHYQKKGRKIINEIIKKNKIPIVCGGTGFYIDALIDGTVIPDVKPNKKLRDFLSKKTTEELFTILLKKDPERAKKIDKKNPVRLIRAIEVVEALGKVPEFKKNPLKADILFLGISLPQHVLSKRIEDRLIKRLKIGMIKEVKKLHENGVSWKKMERFGLEYRYISRFLTGKITREEMEIQLLSEIKKYAKRQMTWFKKNKRIHWVKNKKEASGLIKSFLISH
ncbi:MAG: tRNA (adenosine(37)-N6)-dimethylallyltransferase MiaA [Patescibacteria group bacterium]